MNLIRKNHSCVVDIDDVLADFAGHVADCLNQETGTRVSKQDYTSFDFCEPHGISREHFAGMLIRKQVFRHLQPLDGALEGLSLLREKGFDIHLVTARGSTPNAAAHTLEWLKKHQATFDTLDLVPHLGKKSDIYKRYGDHHFLIDDGLHNLKDAHAANVELHPICHDQPWNQHDQEYEFGVNRVSSLLDLAKVV